MDPAMDAYIDELLVEEPFSPAEVVRALRAERAAMGITRSPDISRDLGFIFHWGPYSVPAFDSVESAKRRSTQNGSEWYLKRLQDRCKEYRPTSGTKETAAFHDANFKDDDYRAFGPLFRAEKWDPDSWMTLCRDAGATYVILTARHHDGFCLWPSFVAPGWNTEEVGPKRNLLAEFKAAAERHGLTFGVYYSWMEFGKTATKEYIDAVPREQIAELIGYHPRIWFFDGHWEFKARHAAAFMQEMVGLIHKEIPGALVNDRVGANAGNAVEYHVFADRYIPDAPPGVPWVHINTIGLSWGYNAMQKAEHYKKAPALKALVSRVRALGGGVLLNLGPMRDGQLDPNEEGAIRGLAALP